VKCDLCDREFNNSEELMQHKEQVHPMDERETRESENPEVKREAADSDEIEMPTPAERTR
jgi:hypothetical protein